MYCDIIANNDSTKWETYKKYRNCLNRVIFKSKCDYYGDMVTKNKNNVSTLWETVRELVNFKSKKNNFKN